jgi:dTDP-4-dehydrorhamnose reductase
MVSRQCLVVATVTPGKLLSDEMRILVIGRNGQVAMALARLGAARAHDLTCVGRNDIDIFSKSSIADAVLRFQPEALINAAAYTAVDKAESDQDAAYALNERVPRLLAEVSAAQGLPFIHLSTDYVFDGTKPTPYEPTDPIKPVSIYGASKAVGEISIRAANPLAVVVRTAWVYSDTGSNFVKRMLELGAERDELRIVNDQLGNPTFADDIADACLRLASHDKLRAGSAGGICHFAGSGDVTWYGFADTIFEMARQQGRRTPGRLLAITTDQYPTPARRPANSRLNCALTEATFGIASRPWQTGLRTCLGRLFA